MKKFVSILAFAALAGCSSPSDKTAAMPAGKDMSASATKPADSKMPVVTGTGSGTIQSVDAAAHTVTIAHGPIEALKWPAMTMTFKTSGVDLAGFKQGDQVSFELKSTEEGATVTKIERNN